MFRLFMRKSIRSCIFILLFSLPVTAFAGNPQKHMLLLKDSTQLATYVFHGAAADNLALPTILVRCKSHWRRYENTAEYFVKNGYNFIIQSTRGNGESTGKESFFLTDGSGEQQDGVETLEWIGRQPWSNSKIGSFGMDIDGFLAHLLATANHRFLRAQYLLAAPYNFYRDVAFPGGAYRQNFLETWTVQIEAKYLLHTFKITPYASSFWEPLNNSAQVSRVAIPACHIGGWFQPFISGTVSAYQTLTFQGMTPGKMYQYLVLGPWTIDPGSYARTRQGALDFPQNSVFDYLSHARQFFDRWVKNQPSDSLTLGEIARQKKVRFYLMGDLGNPSGGNKWVESKTWPPETVRYKRYYLLKNGRIGCNKADKSGNAESFRYHPLVPVPTTGGANFFLPAGPHDQQKIELRDDVLIFTGDTLKTALTVAGPVRFYLYAASSARDTDFVVKLTDVYPDGRSMLIAEGIIRARHRNTTRRSELLTPLKVEKYRVDMGHTANVFAPGHRLRISITSSNSPKFEANPNLPKALHRNEGQVVAVNYIYYGGKRKSGLLLPVIEN